MKTDEQGSPNDFKKIEYMYNQCQYQGKNKSTLKLHKQSNCETLVY